MEVDMNWWAILAGFGVSMVLGMVWYSPNVFGNKWMKANSLKQKDLEEGQVKAMILAAIRAFFISFSLYHIIYVTAHFYSEDSFLANAVQVGLWVGITIVALTMAMHDVFESKDKVATKVNIGFEVVSIFLVALVIGLIAG